MNGLASDQRAMLLSLIETLSHELWRGGLVLRFRSDVDVYRKLCRRHGLAGDIFLMAGSWAPGNFWLEFLDSDNRLAGLAGCCLLAPDEVGARERYRSAVSDILDELPLDASGLMSSDGGVSVLQLHAVGGGHTLPAPVYRIVAWLTQAIAFKHHESEAVYCPFLGHDDQSGFLRDGFAAHKACGTHYLPVLHAAAQLDLCHTRLAGLLAFAAALSARARGRAAGADGPDGGFFEVHA